MSRKEGIQVMSLLTNVKKKGKSRLSHCSQMSRKEGNPGYAINQKCQEKRKIQGMALLTNVKKREISCYAITHKSQEKREIQIK